MKATLANHEHSRWKRRCPWGLTDLLNLITTKAIAGQQADTQGAAAAATITATSQQLLQLPELTNHLNFSKYQPCQSDTTSSTHYHQLGIHDLLQGIPYCCHHHSSIPYNRPINSTPTSLPWQPTIATLTYPTHYKAFLFAVITVAPFYQNQPMNLTQHVH